MLHYDFCTHLKMYNGLYIAGVPGCWLGFRSRVVWRPLALGWVCKGEGEVIETRCSLWSLLLKCLVARVSMSAESWLREYRWRLVLFTRKSMQEWWDLNWSSNIIDRIPPPTYRMSCDGYIDVDRSGWIVIWIHKYQCRHELIALSTSVVLAKSLLSCICWT